MDHAWARAIREQCHKASPPVAFFFKQSSGIRTETGTSLMEADGTCRVWREYPEVMGSD
jgi:protein gp37